MASFPSLNSALKNSAMDNRDEFTHYLNVGCGYAVEIIKLCRVNADGVAAIGDWRAIDDRQRQGGTIIEIESDAPCKPRHQGGLASMFRRYRVLDTYVDVAVNYVFEKQPPTT
jgi:hypothetical protein